MRRTSPLFIASLVFAGCLLPMNHAEIQQAQMQHIQRMCMDPNYAYEAGYNAGLDRKRLDTTWVDTSCGYDMRENIRSAYQGGYNTGIANAPIVVPVRGSSRPAYSYTEKCTFSSDCGDGRTCRSNQCMGQGYAGDACWFSSDCLSDSCSGRVCQ